MAKPKPIQTVTPDSRSSIRYDEQLAADLNTILSTGGATIDAIRAAVAVYAEMHRTAWQQGVCLPGTRPHLLAYQLGAQPDASLASGPVRLDGPVPGRHTVRHHA